jgi:hypothetical protein
VKPGSEQNFLAGKILRVLEPTGLSSVDLGVFILDFGAIQFLSQNRGWNIEYFCRFLDIEIREFEKIADVLSF